MLTYNQDKPYVLKRPCVDCVLPENIWRVVTASLATYNNVSAAAVRCKIPCQMLIVQYGRVSCLEGGDSTQCNDLARPQSDKQDTSFVQVSQKSMIIVFTDF